MAKKKTSWREKLNKEQERIIKPIDRDGMGAKAGMIMLIPKPTDVDEVMRQVAHGKLATVATIREYLAKKYEVDFTCPLTTGIFTWIAANAAEEDFAEGKKNIRFLGFFPRKDLTEFYSLLDVFIMPSTVETEGLVVLEANACGTPAVGADAMALKSTIKSGVNGYHYKPGDIKDLDEKVKTAYKNLKSLRKSSKEFVKDRSAANTVKRLVKLYEEVIRDYKAEKAKSSRKRGIGRFLK